MVPLKDLEMEVEEKLRRPVGFVRGFREFIGQYGIIPLAVAVVIGNSVNDLVKSVVENIITPFIALVSPQGKLQGLQLTFHGSVFKVGLALNSLITFLIVAWLVYLVAKLVLRNDDLLKKK